MESTFAVSRALLLSAMLVLAALPLQAAGRAVLAVRHVAVDLPGAPAKVIPADVNGDGIHDLVVVVVYTEVDEIGEDRVEGLVHFAQVIPALFERREVRLLLGTPAGEYRPAGALPLGPEVLHLEAGPPPIGLVALTDDGLVRLSFTNESAGPPFRIEPIAAGRPVLAGTRAFLSELRLLHDLDGDGSTDVLLPGTEGLAVHLTGPEGVASLPVARIPIPAAERRQAGSLVRSYPLPSPREIDGDGHPDLVFEHGFDPDAPERNHVFLGNGDGTFRPLRESALDCHDRLSDLRRAAGSTGLPWPADLAAVQDLDGDGSAEVVLVSERPRGEGFRQELKDAKRPIHEYTFHKLDDARAIRAEPYFRMEAVGHSMDFEIGPGEMPFRFEQFQDLDGDGREDLVTLTLDFSLLQAVKVLATKRIGVTVEFHVFAQQEDRSFREVEGLDLSERLTFDLDDLRVGRLAHFAGDFNGDGRQDFVHLGGGKVVTIHAGQPGCRYPKKPDLVIELDAAPADLALVRIDDLDGDGRSDLRVTHPLPPTDPDETPPVRLDLYLSGGTGP